MGAQRTIFQHALHVSLTGISLLRHLRDYRFSRRPVDSFGFENAHYRKQTAPSRRRVAHCWPTAHILRLDRRDRGDAAEDESAEGGMAPVTSSGDRSSPRGARGGATVVQSYVAADRKAGATTIRNGLPSRPAARMAKAALQCDEAHHRGAVAARTPWRARRYRRKSDARIPRDHHWQNLSGCPYPDTSPPPGPRQRSRHATPIRHARK